MKVVWAVDLKFRILVRIFVCKAYYYISGVVYSVKPYNQELILKKVLYLRSTRLTNRERCTQSNQRSLDYHKLVASVWRLWPTNPISSWSSWAIANQLVLRTVRPRWRWLGLRPWFCWKGDQISLHFPQVHHQNSRPRKQVHPARDEAWTAGEEQHDRQDE